MVPFAGYEMPVQYAAGVMKEHLHTRAAAGLFDVSHMGQVTVRARSGDNADAARARAKAHHGDPLACPAGHYSNASATPIRPHIMPTIQNRIVICVSDQPLFSKW